MKNLSDDQVMCEASLLEGSADSVKVYETDRAFWAPDMARKNQERGVRIAKTILEKEIPTEQGIKLFTEGKTELMPGFRSKKGRFFAAHLTLDKVSGKLGFEFAPRKTKKKDDEEETQDGESKAKKKVAKKKATKKKATKKKATKKKAAKKKVAKEAPAEKVAEKVADEE